jgi:hypothetical protein
MARSPYQGTFQPNARQVVVTAPDAFVLINNSSQVVGCPVCNTTFDINKYITSIQVDLAIDSVPGSASLSLSVPRHTIDDFYFDNVPVISPMMEINIYAKGYYTVEGLPQYYPIFWGLVTEVDEAYSSGEHTVTIHCMDILKWWELCRMDTNPSATNPQSSIGLSLNGNVFAGQNPFDIIWKLAQDAWGDIVVGGGSLTTITKDTIKVPLFMAALSDIMAYWQVRFQAIAANLMLYGSTGVCVRGDTLAEAARNAKGAGLPPSTIARKVVRVASGGSGAADLGYDSTDPGVVAFRTNISSLGVNFWQGEFQTKLEIANAAKDAIGYEFYMDVTGDVVFKPPFYNLDVLSNKPLSWIQDIDIIEWDFSESESEVVTQLTVQGNFSGNVDVGFGSEMIPFTNVTDYHLLRKYGWRPQPLNSEFLGNNAMHMFYYGLDMLDRINSRRHRGTVTIPFRPELRLGFPVYVAPKDAIWYVTGISHNVAFGSRATTTLTLTAKREKFKAPQGIASLVLTKYNPSGVKPGTGPGTNNPKAVLAGKAGASGFPYTGAQLSDGGYFTLKLSDSATVSDTTPSNLTSGSPSNNPEQPIILRDPQTGRILGYPNVVMCYVAPYAPNISDFDAVAGGVGSGNRRVPSGVRQKVTNNAALQGKSYYDRLTYTARSKVTDTHLTNRSWYGLTTAGAFVYAHDLGDNTGQSGAAPTQGVIGELVLVKYGNFTVTPKGSQQPPPNLPTLIRPVSDSRGFEVIGHYRYGRGVSLTDGQLVPPSSYQAANVGVQVALSGDMLASITAQAQGLTAVQSQHPNQASSLASLQPDDLRTSGFVSPDTKQSSYGNTQSNFVQTPVYGSPQVTGSPVSVEATQLSQGLTLAQMTVIDNTGSQDGTSTGAPQCMCLLGRSDLAFISSGYQTLNNIAPTTPDSGAMSDPNQYAAQGPVQVGGQPTAAQTQALSLVSQLATAQQVLADDEQALEAAQAAGSAAFIQKAQQALATDTANYNALNAQYQAVLAQISTAGSSGVAPNLYTLSPTQVTTIVDNFLFNLYQTLDTPHQMYEQELRGGIYVAPQPGANGAISVGPNSALGTLAPPFNPASRFVTGDPAAAAQMGSSAAANLSQAWNSFGQALQSSAQIASLSQSVSNNSANLIQMQQQLARLQASLAPGSVSVGIPSPQDQINALQAKITTLQQTIASETLQLQQVRQQQPKSPVSTAP